MSGHDKGDVVSFNFWPSFADLMLSLVLILVFILFLVFTTLAVGPAVYVTVGQRQSDFVQEMARAYRCEAKEITSEVTEQNVTKVYRIPSAGIFVKNEPPLQRILFTDRVLFSPNEYELSEKGRYTLQAFGKVLKERLPLIREIQIQGHADTDPTEMYGTNLRLAALRAMEVFNYFKDVLGIRPEQLLMSATSFGEFKPVLRSENDTDYNEGQLRIDNDTPSKKAENRRIEILLFYILI